MAGAASSAPRVPVEGERAAESATARKPEARRDTRAARRKAKVLQAPLSDPRRSALLERTGIQPALLISQPGDASEHEADRVAARVMAMKDPEPAGQLQRSALVVQRAPARAAPPTPAPVREDVADGATEAAVKEQLSGGSPMAADVAGFFGRRFGADFSDVRIHTDARAANLSTRLGARAFTYGRHVFFNAGQYNPDSEDGAKLIAHELTHTIQQQAVIQLKEDPGAAPRVTGRSGPKAQRGIVSRPLNWVADKANYIPGYRLFTIVIGLNPINMSKVERSGANILRALIEFIPGGGLIVDALNNHGIFEKGGKFIEDQFRSLGMVGSAFRDALMEFIDSLGWSDIFHLGDVWDRAKRIFTDPVDKLISFGKGLVIGIARIVKDAILKPLGRYAAGIIPKWDLLAGVFGRNPITDDGASPAETLIGGFMRLIGQEEIWTNIQKSGAAGKAWKWFQTTLSEALGFVRSIPGRFMETLRSLTIVDIVTIVGAWVKFAKLFASFVIDFTKWAGSKVLRLLEIILEVVAPSVIPYLKKAGAAFNTIIKAPGRFIGFLVQAAKNGFNLFKKNILVHLRRGILDWLLGSLAGANLYIPKSFALPELLKFGLSVIGATWENVRAKLVAAVGETTVKVLETTFDIVKTLVTEGPAAAWEQLLETLSNLKSMVMDAVMDYVKGKVIEAAVEQMLTVFNPAGAFILALKAIYKTVTFIVTKLQQIGALVAAIIDSIAAIAAGNIGPAAAKVESVLARGLSVAISFLANFIGLGDVSKKVIQIVDKIRKPVDKALDKLVTWLVDKARKAGKMAVAGAKSLFQWWKARAAFKLANGEQHTLYFSGEENAARLMMASKPRSIPQVLNDPKLEKKIKNRPALIAAYQKIEDLIASNRGIGKKSQAEQQAHQAKVKAMVDDLAAKLALYMKGDKSFSVSVVTFGSSKNRASFALAQPLTPNPGNTTGAAAKGVLDTEGYRYVTALVPKKAAKPSTNRYGDAIRVKMQPLRQAHLLNAHMHGPFSAQNIALADGSLNTTMSVAENKAKKHMADGELKYQVKVAYHNDTPPPPLGKKSELPEPDVIRGWVGYFIASSISVTAIEWDDAKPGKEVATVSAKGGIPKVSNEVIETAIAKARKILNAHKTKEKDVHGRVATSLNLQQLADQMDLNQNQAKELSIALRNDGYEIGLGRYGVIWTKKK
ncbi:MAG TPA: DUF4157 domain-containing protein [Novosphingobium sp.]|nr:DUF4157 domain-containing protein [Novosphingobium sp.]